MAFARALRENGCDAALKVAKVLRERYKASLNVPESLSVWPVSAEQSLKFEVMVPSPVLKKVGGVDRLTEEAVTLFEVVARNYGKTVQSR